MKRLRTAFACITLVFSMANAAFAETNGSESSWNQFRSPQGDGTALQAGLPAEFGEARNVRWKTAIHDEGWSSPVVWRDRVWATTGRKDGSELFALCVDLKSGKVVHDLKVFDVAAPQTAYDGYNTHATPTPVIEEGRYVITGLAKQLLAVRLDGTGDVTDTHLAWSVRKGVPSISSPVIAEGLLFMVDDKGGLVSCLDARTGGEIWKERLGHGRNHWASPLYADGRIHFFSKEGDVTAVAAAREFRLLANHQFDAGFIAGPAIAGNALILRSESHLYHVAEGHENTLKY